MSLFGEAPRGFNWPGGGALGNRGIQRVDNELGTLNDPFLPP